MPGTIPHPWRARRRVVALASLAAPVLALALAACGGSGVAGSAVATASAGGASSVSTAQYSLRIPSGLAHKVVQGTGGRVINVWNDQISAFVIEAISDPHPVPLPRAVTNSVTGVRRGYSPTHLTVTAPAVPGATAAKLIVDSGHESHSPTIREAGADLIAMTPSGTSVEVLVISRGRGNPDPRSVVTTLKIRR